MLGEFSLVSVMCTSRPSPDTSVTPRPRRKAALRGTRRAGRSEYTRAHSYAKVPPQRGSRASGFMSWNPAIQGCDREGERPVLRGALLHTQASTSLPRRGLEKRLSNGLGRGGCAMNTSLCGGGGFP